jgi:Na+-translocating ferredoxin:NAD+ oxidoreductase RnfE subunit
MTLGIVVFGAAFLVGLGLGTYTRRPLSTAFFVLGSFTALLVLGATGEVFGAGAVLAIVFLLGLVAESVRETVRLLVSSM